MRIIPKALAVRLAVVFVTGFAVLLVTGALGLYAWLVNAARRDFDRRLVDSGRAANGLFVVERGQFPTLEQAVIHVVGELVFADRSIAAYRPDGQRLAMSRRFEGAPILDSLRPRPEAHRPFTIRTSTGEARIVRARLEDGIDLYIAMRLTPLQEYARRLRVTLGLGLPLILLLGGAIGEWASSYALRPIVTVAQTADRIGQEVAAGATSFDRLPPHNARDEIATLTTAFNALVDRLSTALQRERTTAERQRAFLADAAHELRTPVAILRSEAETALGGQATEERLREALQSIAEEARSLGTLVGDLLLFARGEAGRTPSTRSRIYLDDLANHAISRARALPQAAGRTIRIGEFEAAPVLADPELIERAVLSLVDNALVHAPGSPIEVSTGVRREPAGEAWSYLAIRDWGPGIAEADQQRIFDRFVRLNTSVPGSGLGLAIARWVTETHGGRLTLSSGNGQGTTFTLLLPASA